jgi:hypothetical protein
VKLSRSSSSTFVTNLDAFEGNSGSPVLNSHNEVVGILVSGTPMNNLIEDQTAHCYRYNRCDENGSRCLLSDADSSKLKNFQGVGSDVQRIDRFIQRLRHVND